MEITIRSGLYETDLSNFIVNTNDNSEHPFIVYIPDMEILTEGDTIADAIEMARDAIGLAGISMEDNKEELPVPSDQAVAIEKVKQDTENIDLLAFQE